MILSRTLLKQRIFSLAGSETSRHGFSWWWGKQTNILVTLTSLETHSISEGFLFGRRGAPAAISEPADPLSVLTPWRWSSTCSLACRCGGEKRGTSKGDERGAKSRQVTLFPLAGGHSLNLTFGSFRSFFPLLFLVLPLLSLIGTRKSNTEKEDNPIEVCVALVVLPLWFVVLWRFSFRKGKGSGRSFVFRLGR